MFKLIMKIFILSPHIDDAAFGLTLTISELVSNNIPVTIINCFTVTKWTAIPVADKSIDAVSFLRKNEDVSFYKSFKRNINIINLDLLDAPLRNGYIFQSRPFEQNEWELIDNLGKLIEKHVDGLLFCPLAIGNHIDHAVCREAVIRLYKNTNVIFFEDLPYARRISDNQLKSHVKSLEEQLEVNFTNCIINSENSRIDKNRAIRLYESQLNEEICSEIVIHMNTLKGERLWGEEDKIEELRKVLKNKF